MFNKIKKCTNFIKEHTVVNLIILTILVSLLYLPNLNDLNIIGYTTILFLALSWIQVVRTKLINKQY